MYLMKQQQFIEFILVIIIISVCSADKQGENENDKVMVDYLKKNNYLQGRAEIIFLLDRSGSVGAADFEIEIGFVESFLTHIVVDENATRVAVISYSDTAVRHIDYLKEPKTKCFLAQELHDVVYENSRATNIAAAFDEARLVFQKARPNVNKVIVLISDGLATMGPDPVPIAAKLKAEGIQIFCFGVGRFLKKQLQSLASSLQHVYTCLEFREFKRLARKIRGDPHESSWSNQALKLNCDHLCDSPYKGEPDDPGCCGHDARCSCALKSGVHSCVCNPGYFGLSGLAGKCKPCPRGTYKSTIEPTTSCTLCPAGSTTAELSSTRLNDCYCMEGYVGDPSKEIPCKKINCPSLQAPARGFILGPCDNIYGSTCHFMCQDGFELVNPASDVRICKSNGEWTTETAVCREIRCEPPRYPSSGRMNCDYPLTVGKKCTFRCHPGYIQEGSQERECLSSKNWSGVETKCIPIQCEVPPPLRFGRHTCTWNKKTSLHDTCAYICNDGFELHGSRYLTCRENGQLLDQFGGIGRPICNDVTSPEIRCPNPIAVQTDKGKNTSSVHWKVPEPTDNSGYTPKLIVRPPNAKPGQPLPIGRHVIIYIATDSVGLNSSCRLDISVVDREPPMVLSCPGMQKVQTNSVDAPVHWEEPKFVDNSNKILKISQTAKSGDNFGIGTRTVTYVAVDESRNFASCAFEVIVSRTSCPYYPPPINGALTCNDWLYGQMCQTYCNENFDFVFIPADWYVCNSEAQWETFPENEQIPWPDCAKPALPGEVKQKVGFYYKGDCNDPRVQYAIKKLFLSHFANDINEADLCVRRGSCSLKTVQVKCGKIVHNINRQKRSVWDHAELEHLELEFEITINADQQMNDTEEVLKSFLETIRNLKWDEDTLNLGTTPSPEQINFVSENEVEGKLTVTEEKTTLVCKPGSVLTDDLCVLCAAGTYYSNTMRECVDCPAGYYQEVEGQLECMKCHDGTSTEYVRTRNETFCKAFCELGTYSETGLETCMACPIGTFQDNTGGNFCIDCPSGTTTENVGMISKEDCKDSCPPGSFSQNGLQPCEPCPLHHFQPVLAQMTCVECPNQLSTSDLGANNVEQCVDRDPCFSDDVCLNNGTCTREGRDVKCVCNSGFEGVECEKDINECDHSPCSNGSTCINTEGSFYCNCSDGFQGQLCEVEIDECISFPCQNGGTCLDEVNGYTCVCTLGYEGKNCETKRELCFQDVVCQNGGICMIGDDSNSSLCMCEPGFTGIDCFININECENITCKNNGSCVDGINSFTCSCVTGFTGEYCETNIDECENNLCRSGSTCQDLIGSYQCICQPGWNGTHCEIKMENDFILMFPESSATIGNMASMTLNSDLSDATVSLWVQTNDTERSGTPLSYAVASTTTINENGTVIDNALTISDCSEVKIYINNEPIVTDLEIADGKWHHLAFTWSSEDSGMWALYKDGELKQEGKNLRPNDIIRGGGNMIIGQEQDTLGGGFSPVETFTGNITRVNIWNNYFSKNNITELCKMNDDLPDKVLAWPDFLQGLQGDVQILKNKRPTFK